MNYVSLVIGSAILMFIMYFWSMRMREIADSCRWVPVLDPNKDTSLPKSLPQISVIVPANNEEALIGTCLQSILDQDYPNLEIICVDDRSTDRTSEIAGKLFEGRTNCHLISITERFVGWTGKCHALYEGVKYASGEWLAFLDADSSLHKAALRQCLHEAIQRKINFVTLSPKFILNTFWEKALIPTFASMAAILFPLAKVNDPSSPVATANGMFFIISRTAYERIGGHCSVKDLAVEDIGIGKRVKAAGLGILFANGRNLLQTKMYSGFREVLNGWTRILSAAMNYKLLTVLKYLTMHILVSLPSFALGTFLYTESAMELWPSLWFLLPLACLLQMVITPCFFLDQAGLPKKYSVYVILGNLMLIWIFVVMMKKIIFGDALQWRGTIYKRTRYQSKSLEP
ncbi:MAG: glycosyltransferase family 2 protein [Deltaproteobacteria bacterium]|nr:glycosyltransferase family 2 protein [Deltaproteobacteria bacterium]